MNSRIKTWLSALLALALMLSAPIALAEGAPVDTPAPEASAEASETSEATADPEATETPEPTETPAPTPEPRTIHVDRDPEHLTVANTTAMSGRFFTDLWGGSAADIDVRHMLQGYSLVRWNGEEGLFEVDPSVVSGIVVTENAEGDRTYTLALYDDLKYSDGAPITAWDYAFSLLMQVSGEIDLTGGTAAVKDYLLGYGDYIDKTRPLMNAELVRLDAQGNILEGTMLTKDGLMNEGGAVLAADGATIDDGANTALAERVLAVVLPPEESEAAIDLEAAEESEDAIDLEAVEEPEAVTLSFADFVQQLNLAEVFEQNGEITLAVDADGYPTYPADGLIPEDAPSIRVNADGVITDWRYEGGVRMFTDGTHPALTGVRVLAEDTIQFTLDHEYLPFFYEMGLMMLNPYPIDVLAPGVRVMDDGEGVYLANRPEEEAPVEAEAEIGAEAEREPENEGEPEADEEAEPEEDADIDAPVYCADLLDKTIMDPETGYLLHPSVVSGPYTLESFDGVTAEFELNPNYKGDAEGLLPETRRVTFTLTDSATMVERLATGEFDLLNKVTQTDAVTAAMNLTRTGEFDRTEATLPEEDTEEEIEPEETLDPEADETDEPEETLDPEADETDEPDETEAPDAEDIEETDDVDEEDEFPQLWQSLDGFQMSNYPRTGLSFIRFRTDRPAVSRQAVRQAIAWCMDRDQIARDYTGLTGMRADSYSGMGQWMVGYVDGTAVPPVEPPEDPDDDAQAEAYEAELAEWEALSLDGMALYEQDLEKAGQLLDSEGWFMNEETGLREQEGETLILTLVYPEGNAIAETLQENLVKPLAEVGVTLKLVPLPMAELLARYHGESEEPVEVAEQVSEDEIEVELRQPDMFYLAANFDIMFDPTPDFTEAEDEELHRLALEMRETEPGDVLSYLRKWIAFQERFAEALPLIPVYTNVYFDFYIDELSGYDIDAAATWSDALLGARIETEPIEPTPTPEPTATPEPEGDEDGELIDIFD